MIKLKFFEDEIYFDKELNRNVLIWNKDILYNAIFDKEDQVYKLYCEDMKTRFIEKSCERRNV